MNELKDKRKKYNIDPDIYTYLKKKNYNSSEGVNKLLAFAIENKEKSKLENEEIKRINKKLHSLDLKISELYEFFLG